MAIGCAARTGAVYVRPIAAAQPWRLADRWREWTTPHLTFDTDLVPASAEPLLLEIERSLLAFDALVLMPAERPPGRLRVVLFTDSSAYRALGPPNSSGVMRATSPDGEVEPTIYMEAKSNLALTLMSAQHELTHRYVAHAMPQAPPWLNEGLAELYATMRVRPDDVRVGGAPPPFLPWNDVGALLAVDHLEFYLADTQRQHYLLAGAFVQFLSLSERPRFSRYLARLQQGGSRERAFADAFGDIAAQLQARFDHWYTEARANGRDGTWEVERYVWRAPGPAGFAAPRLLSSSEVLVHCAKLVGPERPDRARAQAVGAWLLDPMDVNAAYWSGVFSWEAGDDDASEAALELALALWPNDMRTLGHLLSIRLSTRAAADDFSTVEPLVGRIWPRTSLVVPLQALSRYAHARGHEEEALAYARRMVAGSPECSGCRRHYAALLNDLGRAAEAQAELGRAIDLDPGTLARDKIMASWAAVREAKAACARDDIDACERLGNNYLGGEMLPQTRARGRALLTSACARARPSACFSLANSLRYRRPRDLGRSVTLLRGACNAGLAGACNNLGDAYETGTGVARDLDRALVLYRLAAEHGDAWGFVSLASLAWRGLGLPRDVTQAADWLQHAHELQPELVKQLDMNCWRDPSACALLALARARGIGCAVDATRAAELMRRACERGDAMACEAR